MSGSGIDTSTTTITSASGVAVHDNPGARLGATMSSLARKGLDKLTLVASPQLASYGLWAEQLIAESLGKEGKGIIPIAGEPLKEPAGYGNDRLFVYLRLKNDDNAEPDSFVERMKESGHPTGRIFTFDAGMRAPSGAWV